MSHEHTGWGRDKMNDCEGCEAEALERRRTAAMHYRLFVPMEVWTLNRERREHHMAHRARTSQARHDAKLIALNAVRTKHAWPITPCRIHVWPIQINTGPLADTANHLPAAKAAIDGIVDAGLLPDDTPEHVTSITFYPPRKMSDTGHSGPGIVLTVEAT